MADVSDAEISTGELRFCTLCRVQSVDDGSTVRCAAYEEVRSNKNDTNWLLIDYEVPIYIYYYHLGSSIREADECHPRYQIPWRL
jgi:hypothetical protein